MYAQITYTLEHCITLSSVKSCLIISPTASRTHSHDVDMCSLVCTDREGLEGISECAVKAPTMTVCDSYVNGSHMGVTNELCSATNSG